MEKVLVITAYFDFQNEIKFSQKELELVYLKKNENESCWFEIRQFEFRPSNFTNEFIESNSKTDWTLEQYYSDEKTNKQYENIWKLYKVAKFESEEEKEKILNQFAEAVKTTYSTILEELTKKENELNNELTKINQCKNSIQLTLKQKF
jgi:hypothetical protein